MKIKILLLGRFGRVGDAVFKTLSTMPGVELFVFSSYSPSKKHIWENNFVDINILDFVVLKKEILKIKPRIIINCAAFTNVDEAERKKFECWNLNVTLVEKLTQLSNSLESHLIHFSSDYIFNGDSGPYSEDAKPNPINYYGKSKFASENIILSKLNNFSIIRTNFLYGNSDLYNPTFINSVYNNLKQGKQINVVNSLYSCPVFTKDIGIGVKELILQQFSGIVNFAGPEYLSRFEIALKICNFFKFDKNNIKEVNISDIGFEAKRPIKAGLNSEYAQKKLGIIFNNFSDCLNEMNF
jgi:dTDP-4-dehydrorhamnose reductase